MRILVTGASGLLGANLALQAAGQHEVIGTVNQHRLKTIAFQIKQADLTVPGAVERLLDDTQPDWIINCAALASLEACESAPNLAHQLNTELPARLARHVSRSGARLVHISTDAVFDGQRGDYREEDVPNPLSVYAKTKLAGESAVLQANSQAIVVRVNLFGWSVTGKRSLAEFFYYNLQARQRVKGFTDVIFCPLLVNDLYGIFIAMLAKKLCGLYHVFSCTCTSKYDFGMAIARKFSFDQALIEPISVSQAGLAAARSQNLNMRTDKLAQALGAPPPSWEEGLERFLRLNQLGYPQQMRQIGSGLTGY